MIAQDNLQIVGEVGSRFEIDEERAYVIDTRLFVDYLWIVDLKFIRLSLIGKNWCLLQKDIIGTCSKCIAQRIIVVQLNVDGGRYA